MSLLTIPTMQSAQGEVKEIFDEIEKMFGRVPNGIRQWSVSPNALKKQWESIKLRLSEDVQTQKLHTIVRYLVSGENECEYCIGFNGAMLMNMFGMSLDKLERLRKDPSSAPLDEKNKALLLFALQATKTPDEVNADHISGLKSIGISETQMFDIVHAASHMYVVNTLFRTFKVEQDF